MSAHPLNLGLRLLLEVAGLVALGYWGWTQPAGIWRPVLGLGLPLLAAALWGIFRVPEDTGKGLVAVRGLLRLLLEFCFFAAGAGLLLAAGQSFLALVFAALVVFHYAISYDRVAWLLRR